MGFDESDEYDKFGESVNFTFELLNSDDGKTVTLVCVAERELTPDEYVKALKEFTKQIDIHGDLEDRGTTH